MQTNYGKYKDCWNNCRQCWATNFQHVPCNSGQEQITYITFKSMLPFYGTHILKYVFLPLSLFMFSMDQASPLYSCPYFQHIIIWRRALCVSCFVPALAPCHSTKLPLDLGFFFCYGSQKKSDKHLVCDHICFGCVDKTECILQKL